jgi:nucleotide-binding universal stress UspA family protein
MHMLIDVGIARPQQELLQVCGALIQKVATALTVLMDGGRSATLPRDQLAARLGIPAELPLDLRVNVNHPWKALRAVTRERQYDLVICGRQRRSLFAPNPATISQQIASSVLLVRGVNRPPHRILLASSGDRHTLDHVRFLARLAQPLGASVTVLHVLSQQSLIFNCSSGHDIQAETFFGERSAEANILRLAAAWLQDDGIPTQLRVRNGPVIDTIVTELRAGSYDLLVVGEHRPATLGDRFLLRNMTDELVAVSPGAVLIVKSTAEVSPWR